ncbi:MAG: hypothetical protein WD294_10435 [Phycisphaeraceae bacterium]
MWMIHVDFEVPGFGEFAATPEASAGGGVMLTQSSQAAMPDRGTTGLAVAMSVGDDAAYLEHDLGEAKTQLSTRVMLNPATAADGSVVIMRGLSEDNDRSFDVVFDPVTRRVHAEIGETVSLESWPLEALHWHCVELTLDLQSGEATLWVNGQSADAAADLADVASVRRVRLGAVEKQTATAGTLHLDEWVLGDAYVGPVAVQPTSIHSDDAKRWLVIYNREQADSVSWAEHYRQTHSVPYANLLGLSLSEQEIISEAAYQAMAEHVAEHLQRNGLDEVVLGILCGHGVPGAFERDADGELESVASHLARIDGDLTAVAQPLWDGEIVRPTRENLSGVRLTARIDGPTLAFSTQRVDRAAALTQQSLGDDDHTDPGHSAALWIDPHGGASPPYQPRTSALLAWLPGVARQAMRLPLETTDDQTEANPAFTSIDHDGFFWGWSQPTVPAGFFAEPAGQRVFAMQIGFEFATGGLLRDVAAESWVMRSLTAGYAATAGSLRSHTASFVPRGERFFEALSRGWSLGEAWLLASVWLRTPLCLIGDPLMRVNMPRGGWNIYRGEHDLVSTDFAEPIAKLREPQRRWPIHAAHQPRDGETATYVVRHVDEHGREEKSATHVRVRRDGDQLVVLPSQPSWPAAGGWRPQRRDDGWRINAVWPARFDQLGVTKLALERQAEGEAVQVVQEHEPAGDASRATWDQPSAGVTERFRIRVIAPGGSSEAGPWSAWLERREQPTTQLQWM